MSCGTHSVCMPQSEVRTLFCIPHVGFGWRLLARMKPKRSIALVLRGASIDFLLDIEHGRARAPRNHDLRCLSVRTAKRLTAPELACELGDRHPPSCASRRARLRRPSRAAGRIPPLPSRVLPLIPGCSSLVAAFPAGSECKFLIQQGLHF